MNFRPARLTRGKRANVAWHGVEPLERRAYLSAAIRFAAPTTFAAGADLIAIVAVDFDGDGHIDVALGDHANQTVNVFFGDGSGTFTAGPDLPLPAPPQALAIADVNADGKADIVTANSTGQGIAFLTAFLNVGHR